VGTKGVSVNAICPGYTDTPMLQASMAHIVERSGLDEAQTDAWFKSRNQQDRLLDVEEVADAILFMAGDGAKAMNGQIVTLDGGELLS
jgi:NAD(P)-dependent dehydrogenase (short-subunit alcohol dehydrogenase family)